MRVVGTLLKLLSEVTISLILLVESIVTPTIWAGIGSCGLLVLAMATAAVVVVPCVPGPASRAVDDAAATALAPPAAVYPLAPSDAPPQPNSERAGTAARTQRDEKSLSEKDIGTPFQKGVP
jgi:hypothetical protein